MLFLLYHSAPLTHFAPAGLFAVKLTASRALLHSWLFWWISLRRPTKLVQETTPGFIKNNQTCSKLLILSDILLLPRGIDCLQKKSSVLRLVDDRTFFSSFSAIHTRKIEKLKVREKPSLRIRLPASTFANFSLLKSWFSPSSRFSAPLSRAGQAFQLRGSQVFSFSRSLDRVSFWSYGWEGKFVD